MPSARYSYPWLALLAALMFLAPASALASNCGSSAGDSQYIDPLAHCHLGTGSHSSGGGGGSGSHSSTPSPSSSSSPPSSTGTGGSDTATLASTTTTSSGTAATTPAAAGDPSSSAKTLPYTGLDIVPALLVAVALLGGGVILRRVAARDAG